MTHTELRQLIADVQRRQSEVDNEEVKAARGRRCQPLRTMSRADCCSLGWMNQKIARLLALAPYNGWK
jgi:hypothetical protein